MPSTNDKKTLQDYWIRIIYTIACILLAVLAYNFHDTIITPQRNLDNFSYVGTVATLIGLVVAVCEVLHSLKISHSIQREAKALLSQVKSIETASSISDCLAALDDVTGHINLEDYKTALKSFLYFRKICVKILPGLGTGNGKGLNSLGQIELTLSKALHATTEAPLTKQQKTELINKVLIVKQDIEMKNPAQGEIHAAS